MTKLLFFVVLFIPFLRETLGLYLKRIVLRLLGKENLRKRLLIGLHTLRVQEKALKCLFLVIAFLQLL